jgi:outer membrane cobalamin receptor
MDLPPDMPSDPAIDSIVVVESRLGDEEYRLGTQLSVDEAELEVIVPADAEQLLKRLPGISVHRPGGPGGVSEVFLRGAESNFTAVFVDGVRMNDSSNTRGGAFDFSNLAAAEIKRVDVAMGAMSAIYGSDAMAGVIRMDSSYPESRLAEIYGEVGSESDWRAGASATLPVGEEIDLGLRVATLDGGDAVEGSGLELTTVAARLSGDRLAGAGWQVDMRHAERERTSFPEVSGGPELAVARDLEVADGSQSSVSARFDFSAGGGWQSELTASHLFIEDDVVTPAVAPGVLEGQPAFTTDTEYRRSQLFWSNRLELDGNRDLAAGLDLVDEDGRDDGSVDLGFAVVPNAYRLDRTIASGFLEYGQDWLSGVSANLAVRVDHFESDTRLSGKIGVAKSLPAHDARLWARIANGFKLPSFFALGNPLYGNPDLEPEKVRNIELGYDQSLGGRFEYSVSVFTSRYDNLVDFDFETFTNVNRGRIDIDGVTASVSYLLDTDLRTTADATWAQIDSASGELRRRPEETAGIGFAWEPGAWSLDATMRYVGSRLITSIPTGDVRDGAYTYVDATLAYSPSDTLRLWLAVDNLFDSNYEDAPGFPAPGVTVRVGFRMTM